jgi:cyclopropane-fatty-acyl-phospholipid synthase
MDFLMRKALARIVGHGALAVITANGTRLAFGDGSGAPVTVRFTDRRAQWAFLSDPDLRLGELYMDGRLQVEQGTIYDFVHMLLREAQNATHPWPARLIDQARTGLWRLRQLNRPDRSKRNVAHHYDLDGGLYDLFLDGDKQYSCAYFEHPGQDIEAAQLAKKRHIAAKLLVGPRHRVLDIGCGWGGLALYLAEIAGAARVDGVTLSEKQLALAQGRAAERGLQDRIGFSLTDYRAVTERFDRIVSVGMFEHVGATAFRAYFDTCRRLLADDGVMLLHTIGSADGPGFTTPWLDRYIFPGGYIPALSEILKVVEASGLIVTDIEILRLHYATTLRAWRERFLARRDEAVALYDERFCRMWEFYLASAEVAFRCEGLVVFQLQLARQREAVPQTRAYIAEAEHRLRASEARVPAASPQCAAAAATAGGAACNR